MTDKADGTGARLFLGESMGGPEIVPLAEGTVALFSTRSPDKADDKRNEDSLGLFPIGPKAAFLARGHSRTGVFVPCSYMPVHLLVDQDRTFVIDTPGYPRLAPAIGEPAGI